MSVTKEETKKSATNVNDGDFNPNNIEKFVDFKAERVTVYSTDKVAKHYPKVGTAVALEKNKAAKWVEKGYATAKPVVKSSSKTEEK